MNLEENKNHQIELASLSKHVNQTLQSTRAKERQKYLLVPADMLTGKIITFINQSLPLSLDYRWTLNGVVYLILIQ